MTIQLHSHESLDREVEHAKQCSDSALIGKYTDFVTMTHGKPVMAQVIIVSAIPTPEDTRCVRMRIGLMLGMEDIFYITEEILCTYVVYKQNKTISPVFCRVYQADELLAYYGESPTEENAPSVVKLVRVK